MDRDMIKPKYNATIKPTPNTTPNIGLYLLKLMIINNKNSIDIMISNPDWNEGTKCSCNVERIFFPNNHSTHLDAPSDFTVNSTSCGGDNVPITAVK